MGLWRGLKTSGSDQQNLWVTAKDSAKKESAMTIHLRRYTLQTLLKQNQ